MNIMSDAEYKEFRKKQDRLLFESLQELPLDDLKARTADLQVFVDGQLEYEDIKEWTLSRDDLPGLDDEPMPAAKAILHEISGKAWDVCDDAGLPIKDYDYDIEEVEQLVQNK